MRVIYFLISKIPLTFLVKGLRKKLIMLLIRSNGKEKFNLLFTIGEFEKFVKSIK